MNRREHGKNHVHIWARAFQKETPHANALSGEHDGNFKGSKEAAVRDKRNGRRES